ncbi:reverse transcriptase domain-containing protein [Tanacetum coccineum]
MEKLVLALVHAARRLRRKIGQVGGRVRSLWHQIRPKKRDKRTSSRQFLDRHNGRGQSTQVKTSRPDNTLAEGESRKEQEAPKIKTHESLRIEIDIWKLYTNGASNEHGSRAGLILIDPKGIEYSYALRLNFSNSNNDAEYEALLAGLRIATKMKISHIPREENRKDDALSKLAAVQCEGLTKGVLIEELNERSMDTAEMLPRHEQFEKSMQLHHRGRSPVSKVIPGTIAPMHRFGIPATIITNNGTQLINDPFKSWTEGLGIQLVSTSLLLLFSSRLGWCSVYRLCSLCEASEYKIEKNALHGKKKRKENYQLEMLEGAKLIGARAAIIALAGAAIGIGNVQGIKTRLHQEGEAWVEELPNVLWAHMTTPKTSNGETPFSLAYGTEVVIPA